MPIPLDQDLQNPDQLFGGEFPAAAGKELRVCLFEKLIDGESFQRSGCKTLPLFDGVENLTGDPVAGCRRLPFPNQLTHQQDFEFFGHCSQVDILTFDIFAKVPEIDFLSVGHLHEKGEEQRLCRCKIHNPADCRQVRRHAGETFRSQMGFGGGLNHAAHGLHQRVPGEFQQRGIGGIHGLTGFKDFQNCIRFPETAGFCAGCFKWDGRGNSR